MSPIQQMLLGVGAVATKTYVDDIFSTYLWKGTGSSLSINNGIDLSGEGGLTWLKGRSVGYDHALQDTVQGTSKYLKSSSNQAPETGVTDFITSFNNNGFSLGTNSDINNNGTTYSSWTFRKSPGFFDVVTYTGNATTRSISHSLGSTPGLILIKDLTSAHNWIVYHRSLGNESFLQLNGSNPEFDDQEIWNYTSPTSTNFTIHGNHTWVNTNNNSYVAYIFAGGESGAATARSVDFDGSGDYFETNSSSDYTLGTGDFTLEYWIKQNESAEDWVVNAGTVADWDTNGEIVATYCDNTGIHRYRVGTTNRIESTTKLLPGQWNHVAIVRSSGTVKMYINGTKEGVSYSDSTNYTFTDLTIGRRTDTSYTFNGSLSNLRLVVGTAVYTSSFKPPTEPLTNITNTKLLCFNNSSTTGATVGTITANGDPTASIDSPFDDPAGFVFGDAGDQNVIKTGSYVGDSQADGPHVYLGWEPQYLLIKNAETASTPWQVWDSMRGVVTGGNDEYLSPNNSDATASYERISFTPTGFKLDANSSYVNESGKTLIYIAIRRPDGYVGKPPELGTGVFAMDGSPTNNFPAWNSGFPVDFAIDKKPAASGSWEVTSRFMANNAYLVTDTNAAEATYGTTDDGDWRKDSNTGFGAASSWGGASVYQSWMWKRHAGFDVVTYKGDEVSGRQIPHSLNKTIEMMWIKCRNNAQDWVCYHKGMNGGTNPEQYYALLNDSGSQLDRASGFNDTAPTSTHFTLGDADRVNGDYNYIAMLFASTDVSAVGSYTGNGSNSGAHVTVGFTPRFLWVRRTDAAGSWYVVDTLRGLSSSSANDDTLYFNQDVAQTTGQNWVITSNTGFSPSVNWSGVNASGGNYIYYAHA